MCDDSLKLEEKVDMTIPTLVESKIKSKWKNKMVTTHMNTGFLSLLAYT